MKDRYFLRFAGICGPFPGEYSLPRHVMAAKRAKRYVTSDEILFSIVSWATVSRLFGTLGFVRITPVDLTRSTRNIFDRSLIFIAALTRSSGHSYGNVFAAGDVGYLGCVLHRPGMTSLACRKA